MKADTALFGDIAFSQEILCDWVKEKSIGIVDLKIKVCAME